MKRNLRDEFARTECSCRKCCAGCLTQPGSLAPGDAERIAEYKGITGSAIIEFVKENFCASTGILILVKGEEFCIPTVVPKQKDDESCVFFKDGQCSIHPVAPFGCSHFDHHMSDEEAHNRSKAQLIACWLSKGYTYLWTMLETDGQIASPIQERKMALFNKLQEIEDG